MASEMMDGFIAGKMDSNGSGGCCMPVMPAYGMPWGYGMGMGMGYGAGGMWEWFPMLLIAGLLFGGNGWGFGGCGNNAGLYATQADVRAAVDQQTLISKLDQQTYGLADSTYALNNAITNGFHGVDSAICNLGFNVQQGFNGLGHQLADCCCTTQRAIDGVNYNMAKGFCDLGNIINTQTRDIIDNQNANYRGLMDFMVQSKIDKLQSENDNLRLKASQAEQNGVIRAAIDASTAEILRRTGHDCPTAAYLVQPPTAINFPTNGCGTVQFGGYGRDQCCQFS